MTNDAVVSSTTASTVNGNNRATVDTTINGQANLSLQKIDTPDPVKAGKLLTYELKVSNAGPSLARNVLIVDDLPSSYVTLATADTRDARSCSLSRSAVRSATWRPEPRSRCS